MASTLVDISREGYHSPKIASLTERSQPKGPLMKQAWKRALTRLAAASGLLQAILPGLIKETRRELLQDWKHQSDRLARKLEKSQARQANEAARAGAAKLSDLRVKVQESATRVQALVQQVEAGQQQLSRYERQLEESQLRVNRLESLLMSDEPPKSETLEPLDIEKVAEHVNRRLETISVSTEPFAHAIIDDILPEDLYELLVEAIPPKVFFAKEKKSKHDFRPMAKLAPQRTKAIWGFMDQRVCPEVLMPILLKRFEPLLQEHLETLFGHAALDRAQALPLTTFDGRIMRRRPGYQLGPHQDPKRYYLTALLYLPNTSSQESSQDVRWGTQLFSVGQDYTVPNSSIYYPEDDGLHCDLVKTAPYRRNSLLVFLNHRSLHGAHIPPEEAPADLERFAFQFYVGPEPAALEALVQTLPDEHRQTWRSRRAAAASSG